MFRSPAVAVLLLASATLSAPSMAQTPVPTISGIRLDVVATGEVTRVPDVARISAGVVTQAPTATAAIAQNARRMESVRAALKAAGIADRDIQTSSINLNPDYRYEENRNPVLTGYRASNEVAIRFRDIGATGKILDALVAQGANQINGPMLNLDKPEEALNEARVAALASARARATMYAGQLGKRVGRILSISETGGAFPPPMPMVAQSAARVRADTQIDPGEQVVTVSLAISFELE